MDSARSTRPSDPRTSNRRSSRSHRPVGGQVMLAKREHSLYFLSLLVNMSKSYDGLYALVREQSPLDANNFLFLSKDRTRPKGLYWDGTGFNIWIKLVFSDWQVTLNFQPGRPKITEHCGRTNFLCRAYDSLSVRNGYRPDMSNNRNLFYGRWSVSGVFKWWLLRAPGKRTSNWCSLEELIYVLISTRY